MLRFVFSMTATLLAGNAFAQDAQQVQIGGEPEVDACSGFGQITGLDPNGDNFLSVRTGPGTEFSRIDRLGPDQKVWLCDVAGNWFGVVYAKESGVDCGVSSPVPMRVPYNGACQSGWVYSKYVMQTAG